MAKPSLEKSRSCEGAEVDDGGVLEAKRRSIYAQDCRGRTEAQACNKCQAVAEEVKDIEQNKEFFDIDTPTNEPIEDKEEEEEPEEMIEVVNDGDSGLPKIDVTSAKEIEVKLADPVLPSSRLLVDNVDLIESIESPKKRPISRDKSPRSKRRFDSVRNLLEKARQKLQRFRSRSRSRSKADKDRSRTQSQGPPMPMADKGARADLPPAGSLTGRLSRKNPERSDSGCGVSSSSPNTPAQLRKAKRGRSFSPVR